MNQTLSGIKEAWDKNKRPILVVVAFISVLVLIGCGIYWARFFSWGFSNQKEDWYYFSVYITAVTSFLNLLVVAILSYLIYRHNGRICEQSGLRENFTRKTLDYIFVSNGRQDVIQFRILARVPPF